MSEPDPALSVISIPHLPALQFAGDAETPFGRLRVLLCIDADRPHEFLAQWTADSNDTNLSGGCLFTATVASPNGWTLHPEVIFRACSGEGLFSNFALSIEERAWKDAAKVELRLEGNTLVGTWSNTQGAHGSIYLRARPPKNAIAAQLCSTWEDFRRWAEQLRAEGRGHWFRGQGDARKMLLTTLHRLRRYRLDRYLRDELPRFSVQAEAALNRPLDMANAKDYSVVMGLARHHGMPTPVLDWTASPYIAAFFAFADAIESQDANDPPQHVRVYALSNEFVSSTAPPIVTMFKPRPFVATLMVGPIHNPRLSAQQGAFLITNVGDVETMIVEVEQLTGKRLIAAADIPAQLAASVLKDLAFMGLNASTMFPGLDGIGRTIRHEMLSGSG